MISKLLSFLFPVRLPNFHHVIFKIDRPETEIPESGIGQVQSKPYRDGLERYWANREYKAYDAAMFGIPDKPAMRYWGNLSQYRAQMNLAQEQAENLVDAPEGYEFKHVMHDEYELVPKEKP